jgi:hypothetical protein
MSDFVSIILYGLIFNTLPLAVLALLLFLASVPKNRLYIIYLCPVWHTFRSGSRPLWS